MPSDKDQEHLRDLDAKVRNAREAARRDDAGARAQADLKLLEQEALGEKLRARHGSAPAKAKDPVDAKLDKALKDTFPGSDPVSFQQPAPLTEADADLPTVDTEQAKAASKKGR
jgi:hypothetical protein